MSLSILLLAVCLTDAPGSAPAGERQSLRVPVTRDTWFSNVGQEADCNLGGASKLKVKSIQEMSLIDFDPEPLRGRVIRRATLHVRLTSPEPLHRMTVSSFAAPWVEGTAESYAPQAGSSTHRHREYPEVPWTFPGSDLCDVILGRSGTLWHSADSTAPDENGWQQIPVDPRVLAARTAGVSYGCLVFDDTGSEWTRQGEKFSLRLFPNRFFASREAGAQRAPYFTVELGDKDDLPPEPPADLASDAADLLPGEAYLTWQTPADRGPAGVIGFFVEIDGREVPRYLIPAADASGKRVSMHLRDLSLAPSAEVVASISAVDAAGNRSAAVKMKVRVSDRQPKSLPEFSLPEKTPAGSLPRLGSAEIAVIDALDKVQPVTGELTPQEPNGYLASNHLWNAKARRIELFAAKNEFVDFQLLVRGSQQSLQVEASFDTLPLDASIGRLHYVTTRRGLLPDPVLSADAAVRDFDGSSLDAAATRGYLVELYLPHDAKSGKHEGMLKLRLGTDELELPISLTVWDFTLPDFLSFLPEMNCYGLPANERDYYRLAHAHRTVLNRVPYHQNGSIAEGCAPKWDGGRLDWTAWDRRFGAYLDGSAFADLPRANVPLECFYLPLHENWPSPIEGAYNGSYWADQAFPASYREAFVSASRQMAAHFGQRGWRDTIFQCFLNGKNNFKANGWSRGSSPWLLDEPANFQDYWALRYFGLAFHEGSSQAAAGAKMFYRCDISRPEWQRDVLDDVLDYNVVGSAFRRYRRMVLDRKQATGQAVVEYGSTNAIEDSNVQPAGWCVDAWTLGADGVLPWQTIGRADSWQQADALALFYPSENPDLAPAPSLRLKAYRRGQQDVEYLTLWMQLTQQPRWAVGQAVREALALVGERSGTGFQGGEDAGVIQYARLLPADLWKLRMRIGQELSRRRPPASRRLVEFAGSSHAAN